MNEMEQLSGPTFGPSAGGDPRQLVILLHGRGADGNDLLGLAPHFAELLPEARFVAPNAPNRCPSPFGGFEWFQLPAVPSGSFLDGVRAAGPGLDAFIDAELAASNLAADSLALVGFSQGTMMSLYVGLRRPDLVACILGYSGRLVGAPELSREITARPPVGRPARRPTCRVAWQTAGRPTGRLYPDLHYHRPPETTRPPPSPGR